MPAAFNITRHSAKLRQSLRCAPLGGTTAARPAGSQNTALCLAPLRVWQTSMCALRRMASAMVTARAPDVACTRASPSASPQPRSRNVNCHPSGRFGRASQLRLAAMQFAAQNTRLEKILRMRGHISAGARKSLKRIGKLPRLRQARIEATTLQLLSRLRSADGAVCSKRSGWACRGHQHIWICRRESLNAD